MNESGRSVSAFMSHAHEGPSPWSECILFTIAHSITKLGLFSLGLSCSIGFVTAHAQPANDDYADRITVTGTSVTVTGNLAGATFDVWPFEPRSSINYGWQADASLWWSWIPAESTPVVLWAQRLGLSENTVVGEVLVWTNLCPAVSNGLYYCPGYGYASTAVNPNLLPFGAMGFLSQAGLEHVVQLKGARDTQYLIQWAATPAPVILQQPANRIASPGQSTLFKVMAMGLPPLQYQWMHNGADLPGETAPMLALNYLTSDQAGDYRVRVSNPTGSIESGGAQLTVRSSLNLIQMAVAIPTSMDRFNFHLDTEPTRSYRIESSTNLVTWFPQASFLIGQGHVSSVVISTNALKGLSIPKSKPLLFLSASEYEAPNEECNNNLKQIRFAKDMWVLEKNTFGTDTPTIYDLNPYFKGNLKPQCPEGGLYLFNSNLELPTCSITHHVLEEPRFP